MENDIYSRMYADKTERELKAILRKFNDYCTPTPHCPMVMTDGKYHCKHYRQFEETCKALSLPLLMDKQHDTAEREFELSCDRLQCDLVEFFSWELAQEDAEIRKAQEPPQDTDGQMKFDF